MLIAVAVAVCVRSLSDGRRRCDADGEVAYEFYQAIPGQGLCRLDTEDRVHR